MASTISPGETVVFVGDSITFQGWMDPAVAAINATWAPVTVPTTGVATGTRAIGGGTRATATPVTTQRAIIAVNSGVSQNKIANLAAAVTTRVSDYNPDHVVVEVGVNDCVPPAEPFTPTPLVDFRASYDDFLEEVIAANPTASITCLSILLRAEHWAAGPVWDNFYDPPPSNPSYTPSILQYNTEIQASAVAHGAEYVNLRDAALAYEVANNSPAPGEESGCLTFDAVHPNEAGKALMSAQYMLTVTVTP